MKEHFQSRFVGGNLSVATNGVARIDVPFPCKIKYISIKTGVDLDMSPPDTGSSFWNVRQNGTSLFTGDEFEIGSANNFADKTLNIDAAKDDVLLLDLTSITQTSDVVTPIIWQVTFDDEVSEVGGADLPDGDLDAATNKLEKVQGRNITIAEPPGALEDLFDDGVFNADELWNVVQLGGTAITESGGLGHFNCLAGQAVFVKSNSTFDFNDNYLIFDIPTVSNGMNVIHLGICDPASSYINIISNRYYNGVFLFSGGTSQNSKVIAYKEDGSSGGDYENTVRPQMVRIRTSSSTGKFYVDLAGADGVFTNRINFDIGALNDKCIFMLCSQSGTTGSMDINSITSNMLTGEDVLQQFSAMLWDVSMGAFVPVSLAELKAAMDALP